jgi:branched-chain amino acid transport system substrate-binding protein
MRRRAAGQSEEAEVTKEPESSKALDALGRPISRRRLLEASAAGLGALAFAPVANALNALPKGARAARAGSIKIGLLESQTGVFAALGRDQIQSARLFVDLHGGKLGGLDVDFAIEDDQGNPSIGLQKAQKLVTQDGVDITVGVISSAVALALRDFFHSSRKLLVVTNASANAITGKQRSPYVFRTSTSSFQNSYPLGPWAARHVGKRAVLILPDYAAGHELGSGFTKGFNRAGGKVVKIIPAPLGTTDFGSYLTSAAGADADFVWTAVSGTDALNLVKQYKQFGLKNPLIGVGSLTTQDVLPAEGSAALGIYTNYSYSALLNNAANKKFVAAYKKEYGDPPSPYAAFMWDAMNVIDTGLRLSKGDKSPDKLIPAMERVKFASPRGHVSMDKKSHNLNVVEYLLHVEKTRAGIAPVPKLVLGTMSNAGQISGEAPLVRKKKTTKKKK